MPERLTKEEEQDIRKHAAQPLATTPAGIAKAYPKAAEHRKRLLFELACVGLDRAQAQEALRRAQEVIKESQEALARSEESIQRAQEVLRQVKEDLERTAHERDALRDELGKR